MGRRASSRRRGATCPPVPRRASSLSEAVLVSAKQKRHLADCLEPALVFLSEVHTLHFSSTSGQGGANSGFVSKFYFQTNRRVSPGHR